MHLLVLACSIALGYSQIHVVRPQGPPVAPDIMVQGQAGGQSINGQLENGGMSQGQINTQPLFPLQPTPLEGTANVQTPFGNSQLNVNQMGPQNGMFSGSFQPNLPNQAIALPQVMPRPQFQPPRPGGGQQNNQPGVQQNHLSCGFTCSRQSSLLMMLEGEFSRAACSDKTSDPSTRCNNCCGAIAVANEIDKSWSSGFISTNGVDCICCINRRC